MRSILPLDIMRYYVSYNDIEKQILEDIKNKNSKIRELAYRNYVFNYMKIGRNLKKDSVHMVLTIILNMLKNEGNLGAKELSKRFVSNELVSKKETKSVIVASTKLLWLYDKKTIIMDSLNMKVLKTNNYDRYIKEWDKVFNEKIIEIDDVIKNHFKNFDPVINEDWFKMRVFDLYLQNIEKSEAYKENKMKLS